MTVRCQGLIIAHCHEKVKHQGKGFTINEIRSNGYWILGMNRAVASQWYSVYLLNLAVRQRWHDRKRDLNVDDIV